MQQIGGALGLAALSTVSLHFVTNRAEEVAGPISKGLTGSGTDPSAIVPGTDLSFLDASLFQATFAEGATHAFLIASILMLGASVVVWSFLNVKHAELATDGPEGVPAHVG